MKFSNPNILVVGIPAVAILAVLGFLFIPNMFVKKADIQLTVSAAGLKFTGASGHHGTCKSTNNTYCVNVPPGKTARITFRLVGLPNWGFSRMQLVAVPSDVEASDVELSDVKPSDVEPSDVESSDVESYAKLDFGNHAGFKPTMQADFYVKVNGVDVHPDTNGIIELGGSPGVGKNFTLIDKNNLKQIYKYSLEACKGDNCKRVDPRVENEG